MDGRIGIVVFTKRPTSHKDDRWTRQTSKGTNPTLRRVGSGGYELWMRDEAWGSMNLDTSTDIR